MPSSYSTNLKIELMATGENSGTWGTNTNTNLGTAMEQAIIGYGNPDYTSDANLTITISNSSAAQAARALVLNVTSVFGSLTATRELIVPTIQKQYIVQNNTTGGQSITVKTSAGTGITVPTGRKAHLYVDGTNVIQMFDFVDINGGTIDGATVGASSASTGAFTTLSATGAITLNTTTNNQSYTTTGAGIITISSGTAGTIDGMNIGATTAGTGRFSSITNTGLTSGRVVYSTTGGLETDSANLTFNGTTLTANTIGAFTLSGTIAGGGNQINNVIIGTTTPLAGAFTTLSATGNTTLGDATTDTVTVSGYMGLGGSAANSTIGLNAGPTALTGTNQIGAQFFPTGTSAATASVRGVYARGDTAAASFTCGFSSAFYAADPTKGAGSTITNLYGLYIADQTVGTNNYGITSTVTSGTNKWNIYASGTAVNYMAGQLQLGDGSAAAPALSNFGDENTGIFFPAADTIAFSEGGAEAMRLDSSGNLGLGTTAPGARLDVSTASGNTAIIARSIAATNASVQLAGNGNTPGTTSFDLIQDNTFAYVYQRDNKPIVFGTNNTERARIDSSGNVGIGTTAPLTKLHVSGVARVTGATNGANGDLQLWSVNAAGSGFCQATISNVSTGSASSALTFSTATSGTATEVMRIDSSGNLLVGTTTSNRKVTVGVASAATLAATDDGVSVLNATTKASLAVTGSSFTYQGIQASAGLLYSLTGLSIAADSSNPITFVTGGAERMRIDSSGNLLIGQTVTKTSEVLRVASAGQASMLLDNTGKTNGAFVGVFNDAALFSINRNPSTGIFYNTSNYVAEVIAVGSSSTSYISFATSAAANTAATERARIDSSGNLGIGVTSPFGKMQIAQTNNTTINGGAYINLGKGENGVGGYRLVGMGYNTGTDYAPTYMGYVETNNSSGTAGDLVWFTRPSGNTSTVAPTERMRLDSSGNVGIGTTSPTLRLSVSGSLSASTQVVGGATAIYSDGSIGTPTLQMNANTGVRAAAVSIADTTSAIAHLVLRNPNGNVASIVTNGTSLVFDLPTGTERMRISSTGIVTMSTYGAGTATFSAAGVISSVSDETWKIKDGVPVDPNSMINKLEPGYWYYNDEKKETFGTERQLGFYAQNVNAAIGPEAAPTPEEGKPWGYYDRSVLAVTVMSLQKALATIESLTARITALETA